jgi:homoserine/homoserine lactone efflux protein
MSFDAWIIFTLFWVVFVTTPGPNAVNCITNGMNLSFGRAMIGVLGILTQATLFLVLSALGITALIAASPTAFTAAKLIGAGFLIYLGIRSLMRVCHRHNQPQKRRRLPCRLFAIRTA